MRQTQQACTLTRTWPAAGFGLRNSTMLGMGRHGLPLHARARSRGASDSIRFRRYEDVTYDLQGLHEFIVES